MIKSEDFILLDRLMHNYSQSFSTLDENWVKEILDWIKENNPKSIKDMPYKIDRSINDFYIIEAKISLIESVLACIEIQKKIERLTTALETHKSKFANKVAQQ